jgi:hypothetical protein
VSTSFADLLKRGHGYILAAEVEGIGIVFAERIPQRADAASSPSLPASYTGASGSLLIRDGQALSIEADRDTGIGRGTAWEMLLSWESLQEEGLLDVLFKRPTVLARLTESIAWDATTIGVDDVTGWPSSGTAYLGRERIDYAGVDAVANEFTGCTRGVLGLNYDYDANDPGDYKTLTTIPTMWRGRFVTLHQHLVSAEGRILDSTWFTGDYHRQIWRGFIDATPMPDSFGMRLRCLPLCRLPAREIGQSPTAEILSMYAPINDWPFPRERFPVYVTEQSQITIRIGYKVKATGVKGVLTSTGPDIGTPGGLHTGIQPLRSWWDALADRLTTDLVDGSSVFDVVYSVEPFGPDTDNEILLMGQVALAYDVDVYSIYSVQVEVSPGCYWIRPTVSIGWAFYGNIIEINIAYAVTLAVGAWLALYSREGVWLLDSAIPDSGIGLAEADRGEIIRWDQKATTVNTQAVLIRVAERTVGKVNGKKAQLRQGGTFRFVTGAYGRIPEVVKTVLQSSGTGQRGTYDTLGTAAGYGLPADWMDVSAYPLSPAEVALVDEEAASLADLAGGWFRLQGLCLVQRRLASGEVALTLVFVDPTENGGALELAQADVQVAGVSVPRLVEAPNQIKIDTTAGPYAGPVYVINSLAQAQQEGTRSTEISAPQATAQAAVALAVTLLRRGRGQSLIKLTVGPWVDLQVGDVIDLKTAHPSQYDWANASRQPADVPARVVGWKLNLWTGEQELTLLLAGSGALSVNLCPTATIASVVGSVVNVSAGEGSYFTDGDVVTFYKVGDEATYETTGTISTVSGDALTMTGAPAAWVTTGIKVTYPPLASASAAQSGAFLYHDAGKNWGA